jgi:hypothetical protein
MRQDDLLTQIETKQIDAETAAERVIGQSDRLPQLFEGLDAESAAVKYGCAKVLRIISEREPAVLYPQIDFFIGMLDDDNQIMQWEAVHVLGNLAKVDSKGKIEVVLDRYLEPLPGPTLITAANVIGGAAKIALAKPDLTGCIVEALLSVEHARYRTPDCRDVALGHVIKALDQLMPQLDHRASAFRLIERQLENPRNATRKKAEKFVRKWRAASVEK